MLRFVTGQYSADLPLGGMIGYVMDGDVKFAYSSVQDKINEHAAILLCGRGPIGKARAPTTFRTQHRRVPIAIELRHLLLAAN
jgi:hypothetical protein